MNVIIIHGTGGNPSRNWFPWLKAKLESEGCRVFVPAMPQQQSLDSWLAAFDEYLQYFDENTLLVGHSIGPAFLLSILERLKRPVRAAFLVAGFLRPLGNAYFDALNRTFTEKAFDWERIRASCRQFYVISSENDPYVPIEMGRELAARLHVPLTVIPKGGHLNDESGYTEFPLLLELMKIEVENQDDSR